MSSSTMKRTPLGGGHSYFACLRLRALAARSRGMRSGGSGPTQQQSLPPPSTLQILRPWPTAKMAAVRAAVRGALRCRATLLGSGWPALAGCGAAAAAAAAASAGCDDLRPTPRPAAWPASTAALIEELCVLLPAPPLPPTTGG